MPTLHSEGDPDSGIPSFNYEEVFDVYVSPHRLLRLAHTLLSFLSFLSSPSFPFPLPFFCQELPPAYFCSQQYLVASVIAVRRQATGFSKKRTLPFNLPLASRNVAPLLDLASESRAKVYKSCSTKLYNTVTPPIHSTFQLSSDIMRT